MFLKPVDKSLVEYRCRRPKSTAFFFFTDVKGQAQACLAKHLRGGTIAWIAVSRDFGFYDLALVGFAYKSKIVEAFGLRLRARALNGLMQQVVLHHPTTRFNSGSSKEGSQTQYKPAC